LRADGSLRVDAHEKPRAPALVGEKPYRPCLLAGSLERSLFLSREVRLLLHLDEKYLTSFGSDNVGRRMRASTSDAEVAHFLKHFLALIFQFPSFLIVKRFIVQIFLPPFSASAVSYITTAILEH
jgi:hypothetical protein